MMVLMAAWNKGLYVYAASLTGMKEGRSNGVEKAF